MRHKPTPRVGWPKDVWADSELGRAQDIIGGTVLSWGENVPEVVATLVLARAGQHTMALAACFAGPVFNLAVCPALCPSLLSVSKSCGCCTQ